MIVDIIRKLIKGSLKKVAVKIAWLVGWLVELVECRLVLLPAQRCTRSKRVKRVAILFSRYASCNILIL